MSLGKPLSLPVSRDAATGSVEMKHFDSWWKVAKIHDFDGIAVSREDEGRRYLTCPDCKGDVLGYYASNGNPTVYIACDLVKQTAPPKDDAEDFGKLPAGLSKEQLEGLLRAQAGSSNVVRTEEYTVEFTQDRIGLLLSDGHPEKQVEVYAFTEHNGNPGPAELSGKILIGDILTKVNGEDVQDKGCVSVLDLIVQTPRPLTLSFKRRTGEKPQDRPRVQHKDWVNPNKAESDAKMTGEANLE